jgi:alanyl-tRNA synthetase
VDNVGFHMGADGMTVDFNRELTAEELQQLERTANETVRADVPIRCFFPGEDELKTLDYRSKKELSGAVRLVEIEGVDLCACCAPHVSRSGEVGLIKLLDAQRHRGGVRLTLLCGMDAYDAVCRMQQSVTEVSRALSVPREKIAEGVSRQLGENARQKERIAALSLELVRLRAAAAESVEGNHIVFDDTLDEVALRELVNLLMDKCGGLAAAFSGSDKSGYRYIIGSKHVDLRANSKVINAAISGRGGGRSEMIQGSCSADAATIRAALESL